MNNNTRKSSQGRCKCGRYMTLGEVSGGVRSFNYECPECFHRKYSRPIIREEYYEQFERVLK